LADSLSHEDLWYKSSEQRFDFLYLNCRRLNKNHYIAIRYRDIWLDFMGLCLWHAISRF
jgi:hypothetical protein